ncbi:hypothetical protein MBLNU459_g4186t1 [Dothideomycetes sp. NU459]
MSFGGGFGGFGANNNNNNNQTQNTGFGGFGASTNNTGGFGASTTNTGFGGPNNNAGSSLFGGGNTTSSGFGSGGGFGASTANASPFGAKPAFGASTTSTGGGLFGGNTATSGSTGFGGFGANNNNTASTTPAFGSSNTGGGMFGSTAPKPAFGGTTGGSLFGGSNTAGGFGANNNNNNNTTTPSTFGANNAAGGFGGAAAGSQTQNNQGTANTPFAPHIEKDSASSTNSHYQSITFQQPYQAFSFEELRLADYNAGRRYGNTNGQAGAFGQSTGFGGFGASTTGATSGGFGQAAPSTGGGLFGNNNNSNTTASPFGQAQQPAATGGFGTGGGGLFGQKPAGGGLFGNAPASTTQSTGGGVFGTAAPASTGGFGGFGGNNTNNQTATGGGMFGNTANQSKPAFGGFGSTNTGTTGGFGASTGGTGFGQQPAATGSTGLFGSAPAANNNTNAFGGNQQQNNATGGGLFGGGGFGQNNTQQNQSQTGTGGLFGGGGGFGQNNTQNQQKPSLFGASTGTTGGGLFGQQNNQNQPQQTGGLFGNNNNNQQQQQGGGLFGNQQKAPSTSLFGGSTNNTGNTGGGLFGNLGNNQNQNQQTQGGGLFGQNNQQQKPSLFGGLNTSSNNTGGGSLFGSTNNNNNNTGGGLFGQSTQQQQGGNSFFGGSQQNQQQNQQPQLAATLLSNPYGNEQLFSGLGTVQSPVGPLATPLSGAQKAAKRPAALPAFKINPSASLRLITPQKRNPNGYGFSYATYGTPGSAQSFTSNGLGSSLLQSGGLSRSLGKSFSTTNLRSTFSSEDSVLAPGAFTPNNRPYSGGSIRRLKIDRNLRTDLFGNEGSSEPPTLNRKRVSFDASGTSGTPKVNGTESSSAANALVRTETEGPEPTSEELGLLRAPRPNVNGSKTNGTSPARPEMEQVRSNELAIVPEDEAAPAESSKRAISRELPKSQTDQQPGEYYMIPTMNELRNFSREQMKKVSGFTVGRVGVGKIEFSDVDLTDVPMHDLLGGIVKFEIRSATVYESGNNTPPMGKGLNVPSLITLENSWPRSHGGRLPVHERKGPRFDKHLERLQRVTNTEFVSYDPETGVWKFRVEHFTTYGLDDEDDETELGTSLMETEEQTPKADTPTPAVASQEMVQVSPDDDSVMSEEESNPDDTFEFKRGPSKNLPGGFGDQSIYEDEDMADDTDGQAEPSFHQQDATSMLEDPFNSSGSAFAVQAQNRPLEEEIYEQSVVGSFPEPSALNNDFGVSTLPKSILKTTSFFGTPKKDLTLTGDWAEQLQRTVSPKKQDRQAIRERASVMGAAPVNNAAFAGSHAGGKAFSTTMDIMNSLWAPAASTAANATKTTAGKKGFEWPYSKRTKPDDAYNNTSDADKAFHSSVKPSWSADGTLVYAIAGNAPAATGNMTTSKQPIVSEHNDIRFAKFSTAKNVITPSLQLQMSQTISSAGDLPSAHLSSDLTFAAMSSSVDGTSPHATHERAVWRLASILFDPLHISCASILNDLPDGHSTDLEQRIRRDALSDFWMELVKDGAAQHAKDAATAEEEALAHLTCNNIEEACAALIKGRDYRLASLVAQLPGDTKSKSAMSKQIESWASQNITSEMTEPVRALYALTAGNTCISQGKNGAAEDRASTFGISSRFELDWRRSFGLRLWFGVAGVESLADAVQSYSEDLASGKETVRPVPFFTEQSIATSWDDPNPQLREDTLYGLLALYARKPTFATTISAPINDLLSPSSVSGDPLDARLAWQLAVVLRVKRVVSPTDVPDSVLDNLTLALSAQLEAASKFTEALKVLLHLSDDGAREQSVRDLLYRRASDIFGNSTADQLPSTLVDDINIPTSWLWHARALYARSVLVDPALEVTCLLRSGAQNEAHAVLCRQVGPQAVVAQDYDSLRELLGHFDDLSSNVSVEGWPTGGQVYFDFIHLLDLEGRDGNDRAREEKNRILTRLTAALPSVLDGRAGKVGLEERVAVGEMAGIVKAESERLAREEKGVDRAILDRLPVSGDRYAKQGVDWSRAYYRAVAA